MTDEEILYFYSQWSEDYYCAGFLIPSPEDPEILYLRPIQYDYEREMLAEFHKQESAS